MKRKGILFELTLLVLVICAGVALILLGDPSGTVDDTPSLPGIAGGDISISANIAETNRKIVEQVEVSGGNVQNVLKTLARPAEYETESTVTYYYEGGHLGTFYVKTWVKSGLSRAELHLQQGAGRRLLKNSVLTKEHVYVWESAADTLYSGAAGDFEPDDLGHVPAYESVFDYPAECMAGGGIDTDLGAVWAETVNPETGYIEKWQVEIGTGLLMLYECFDSEQLVCRVQVYERQSGAVEDSVFMLPNGLMPE